MSNYEYLRVSTGTQAEKGFGLQEQDEGIRKYAAEHGMDIAEPPFIDAGISGRIADTDDDDAISKRTALLQLLSICKEGDTIIVLNTSRLWRSDVAKVIVRRELMKRKVILKSVQQPNYDLYATNPNDRLINGMMELLDEWERASIAIKLAGGRAIKANKGDKPAGVCPFGYDYSDDRKSVVINEAEAATVRMIFSEGQKGKSLRQIADILNGKGIKTRRGKEWAAGNVQVIMKNRFYIGELQHQGKAIKGNHEPIISKIQFGKVQSQLEQRHK